MRDRPQIEQVSSILVRGRRRYWCVIKGRGVCVLEIRNLPIVLLRWLQVSGFFAMSVDEVHGGGEPRKICCLMIVFLLLSMCFLLFIRSFQDLIFRGAWFGWRNLCSSWSTTELHRRHHSYTALQPQHLVPEPWLPVFEPNILESKLEGGLVEGWAIAIYALISNLAHWTCSTKFPWRS